VVLRKKPITNKGKLSILTTIAFLFWAYYQIWSLMYGPKSNEDWGPGMVYAVAIIGFQVLPLLFTLPFAFWARKRGNT